MYKPQVARLSKELEELVVSYTARIELEYMDYCDREAWFDMNEKLKDFDMVARRFTDVSIETALEVLKCALDSNKSFSKMLADIEKREERIRDKMEDLRAVIALVAEEEKVARGEMESKAQKLVAGTRRVYCRRCRRRRRERKASSAVERQDGEREDASADQQVGDGPAGGGAVL